MQAMNTDSQQMMNLYENLQFSTERELVEQLMAIPYAGLRVERITSSGQTSAWYDQDEAELVFLLEGEAHLELIEEGKSKPITLQKGDGLWIPAQRKHRVTYTSANCLWLCVFIQAKTNTEDAHID